MDAGRVEVRADWQVRRVSRTVEMDETREQ
jgi:hypothetical protein